MIETEFIYWLLRPATWVLAGLLLSAMELAIGTMIALPLGIAALAIGGYLFLQQSGILPEAIWMESWKQVAIAYSAVAVPAVILLRRAFLRKGDQPDINKY